MEEIDHRFYKITKKNVKEKLATHQLMAGNLELGLPQTINNILLVLIITSDADEGLSDLHTSAEDTGFTKGIPHTCLEPERKNSFL